MRRAIAVIALLALAASGCGGDDAPTSPLQGVASSEGVVSRVLQGRIDLDVTGDVEATWSGETPINILTNVGAGAPREFWQLTVGILPADILEFDDGMKIRPAFDLIGYEGAGDYRLASPREESLTEEELEAARDDPGAVTQARGGLTGGVVFVVSTDDDETITNFNVMVEPCSLEVADAGNRGTIECPEVSNGANTIAFSWSWEADSDAVLQDLTDPSARRPDLDSDDAGDPDTGDGAPVTPDDPDAGGGTEGTGAEASEDNESEYGINSSFQLEVVVDPDDCAVRGATATVQVDTVPDASITLALSYSDAQPHGSVILGDTGVTGDFNWAFVVPPDVPDGPTDLLIGVTPNDPDEQEGSGSGIIRAFEVAAAC